MTKVRVDNFSISLDGYGAGVDQGPDAPFGHAGTRLHEWMFATRTGRRNIGLDGGTAGIDDDMLVRGDQGVGATIMGRNMFGPVRGPWGDSDWRGWWGDEPPYHHAVFVLTHEARDPLEMAGGTTFHFVTDGIEAALARAREAAGDQDVRIGGGPAVVRQYVEAGLVDEMRLVITPVLLGRGERLFDGLDRLADGYTATLTPSPSGVVHALITRG
jgi:dihydrofolate reductase